MGSVEDRAVMTWGALAVVWVVWGSTYLAIRVMVETIPPLLATGVRFLIAGGVFWIGLRVFGGKHRTRITRRELGGAFVIGMLFIVGGNGLVTVAEQNVPSGLAALMVGSVPLFIVLLRIFDGQRVPRITMVGVAVGFAGLAVLVLPGDRPGDAPLWGVLLLILSSGLWAIGSFYASRIALPPNVFAATAWQMLLGGTATMVIAVAVGEAGDVDPSAFSTDSILAFAYLVLAGGLLSYAAFMWLLRNAPISKVATHAYVNPVIAVLLGWLILDEQVTATMIVGTVAVVASVALVVGRESTRRERTAA